MLQNIPDLFDKKNVYTENTHDLPNNHVVKMQDTHS